jgi:hypothetical protein
MQVTPFAAQCRRPWSGVERNHRHRRRRSASVRQRARSSDWSLGDGLGRHGTAIGNANSSFFVGALNQSVLASFIFSPPLSIASGSRVRLIGSQTAGPGELKFEGQSLATCPDCCRGLGEHHAGWSAHVDSDRPPALD